MAEQNKIDEIIQNIGLLISEGNIFEVRMPKTNKGTISGWFNNPEDAFNSIENYIGKHDIYFTMNIVKLDLLSRCCNRVAEYTKTTTADGDIERIQYILVDLDPVRASGISSTSGEKKSALELMKEITKYLKSEGFPSPIICDSGNGFHLLYKVDLENTISNVELLKKFLASLDFQFSNDKVQVDRTTFNPSRIVKLYGTKACKGDSTDDRPHRWSKILKVPEEQKLVSAEDIVKVASKMPVVEEAKKKGSKDKENINIEDWMSKNGIEYSRKSSFHNKGTKYILKSCPWNVDHTNDSSYIIQFDSGAIVAGCLHNSCANENWQSLRKLCEPDSPSISSPDGDEKAADVIVRLAQKDEFFLDQNGQATAAFVFKGHREVVDIDSHRYSMNLYKLYYDEKQTTIGADSIKQAIANLKMRADFSDSTQRLTKRIADKDNAIYYDLCNPDWSVIKITDSSVEKISNPPILFTRTRNMKEQVEPDLAAKPAELIEMIKKHFRFKKQEDINLFAVYLVSCFIPFISHTSFTLSGEKGAAKSTTMQQTKLIVDPASQDLITMPSSKRDLAIILNNNYMVMFDNLDSISAEFSNILCMAVTGGAFQVRSLYENTELTTLELKRCIGLNGINVVATRADLLDRSILLELARISKSERKGIIELQEKFNKDLPKILGSIFNTVSKVLAIGPASNLEEVGRMADFTNYGHTIAEVLGVGGEEFLQAYLTNQNSANEEAISNHPVAAAVTALMRNKSQFVDSVSGLLKRLEQVAEKEKISTKVKLWPLDASALSKRLKEVKSNLEEIGINYFISNAGSYKRITIDNRNPATAAVGGNKSKCSQYRDNGTLIKSEIDDNEDTDDDDLSEMK